MSQRKHGLKVLGLGFLAALCLTVSTATTAQAQGEFTINLGKALSATLVGETEGPATFLVPGLNFELVCQGATIAGEITAGGHGTQKMSFSNCEVPEAPNCIVEPIVASFLNKVVQHGGEAWILFTAPMEEGPFTVIRFKKGTGCVLPSTNPLTGSFIALVGESAVSQLLTFRNDYETTELFNELGIKISYAFGTQPAFLDMSTVWKLTGAHEGMKWGAQ